METYFRIRYEFDRDAVHQAIEHRMPEAGADYICVADGVVLSITLDDPQYLEAVNGGMFCICDSSYVPLYIRWLYGRERAQYCGSEIFMDIVRDGRYRMIFLGGDAPTLKGLQAELTKVNPQVAQMQFVELPFRSVEDFDYAEIARMVEADGADIVWVALGAPKQERFMHLLKPHLHHGVLLGVGAAFKFFSGTEVTRAPQWMVKHHIEFVHRIYKEPRKQLRRCANIVVTLPRMLWMEWRVKNRR